MPICNKFVPLTTDAAFCVCNLHWNMHSQGARHLFWDKADKAAIDKTISACKRDNDKPCNKYVPARDWPEGQPLPDCVCGRPARPSHMVSVLLDGRRAWREAHPPATKQTPLHLAKSACMQFHSTITTPGSCVVCDQKWIAHAPLARGLIIESYYDVHQDWCKCIIMNGDVECSCLSNEEKQAVLDKIGSKPVNRPSAAKESNVGCRQFRPKSTGNTHCQCGVAFHLHSSHATDGCATFLAWRQSHFSNKELLTWFMLLPGKTRAERTTYLESLLSDPTVVFVPPANLVNPDYTSMLALLDTLTGSHHIQSPSDIEKIEAKRRGESATPDTNDTEPLHYCHSCGENTAKYQGQACSDCESVINARGPALVHKAGELNV